MKTILRLKLVLLVCVLMLPATLLLSQTDNSTAHRLYLTAYETMKSADYLKSKGLNADAADMYLEALRLYQKIAEQYPDWQSDLVAYRIDYCRKNMTSKSDSNDSIKNTAKKNSEQKELPAGFGTNYNKILVGPWRIEARIKDDNEIDDDTTSDPIPNPVKVDEKIDKIEEMIIEAKKAERSGDYVSALAIYNNVLEYKVTGEILKGALRSAIRVGDRYAAKSHIELAKKSNVVKDAELKHLFGLLYCLEGNFNQALSILQEAAVQDPVNPLIRVALGVAYAGCNKFSEAEAEMRKALSINSKIAEAYYNLAWIRLALKGKSAGGAVRADYQNALRYGTDPDPILERNIP